MPKIIAVINGPNLNLLSVREPDIYGPVSLEQIIKVLEKKAQQAGYEIKATQSNSEGDIINAVQDAMYTCAGIIINPGGLAHTSISLRDALSAIKVPAIEVHVSNVYAREEFRHHSYVSGVVKGVISGLGAHGYELALDALIAAKPNQ